MIEDLPDRELVGSRHDVHAGQFSARPAQDVVNAIVERQPATLLHQMRSTAIAEIQFADAGQREKSVRGVTGWRAATLAQPITLGHDEPPVLDHRQ